MGNLTQKISVNGWVNLDDALIAAVATYQPGLAKSVTILNNNTVIATLHITDSGTQPADAADGLPLSTTAASSPLSSFTLEDVDLAGIWINTPSAIDLHIVVIGV